MSEQAASAVMMIRPARFGANPETRGTNRFQSDAARDAGTAARARAEFDACRAALAAHGVDVHVFQGQESARLPDEVFPNNWLSLHADGTAVLYPLMAESRRPERRMDVLEGLETVHGYRVTRVLDLTRHERESRYLEGTGSLVFDHVERRAYAAVSPRTDPGLVGDLARALGYEPFVFEAADRAGFAVYHTNVLLSIGTRFALVCAEAVRDPGERERLVGALATGGRDVIELDFTQMEAFAGNALELRGRAGPVIALSASARAALDTAALEKLSAHGDVVAAPIHTIESCGGGSVRCMLAEVFLPRVAYGPGPPV